MIDNPVVSLLFRISLLLVAALIVDACLRRRFVLTLATIWNAILVSMLIVPLAIIFVPQLTLRVLPSQAASPKEFVDVSSGVTNSASEASIVPESGLAENSNPKVRMGGASILIEVVVGIYLIGVIAMVGRLVGAFHALRVLCKVASPVTEANWLERLDDWQAQLGLTGRRQRVGMLASRSSDESTSVRGSYVMLLESDLIDGPFALGILRPVIVIPSKLVPQMTQQGIDAILTHELAHIARADCAWQLLQRIVEAVLWFHPLVWLAGRRIDFIRERACDDFAVRMVGDFEVYGETLYEIAAGMTRKTSYGIGLTINHSSSLSRRLSAVAQSDGNNRCLASARSRWLLTTGVVGAAVAVACLIFDSVSTIEAAAETLVEKNVEVDTKLSAPSIPTPELIAVTWQQAQSANRKRFNQPVWRPDGMLLTKDEATALQERLEGFETHWWNTKDSLRPLVLVFGNNSNVWTGIVAGIVMPDGRRLLSGSSEHMHSTDLKKSAISPSRASLARWPAKIDVEIKIPLENPVLIKTINSITDERVQVGPGAEWYLDSRLGVDRSKNQSGLTAAVLELRNGRPKDLTIYSAQVWLKGKKEALSEDHVSGKELEPGVWVTMNVSSPIEDPRSIERVEFYRQRFRMEQIKGIETHLDLLPPDVDPAE